MGPYHTLNTAQKKIFWKSNPLNGTIDITLPFFRPFKMVCQNDDTVVKELYWTDFTGWEPSSLKLWFKLSQSFNDGIIFDIGCYSGIYSLIAALSNERATVIAFDIQGKCVDRTIQNATENNISNIKVKLNACSANEGRAPFYFYEEEGILSSVASLKPKKMNDKSAMIESVCLDNYLSSHLTGMPVRLIKIDVEDAEVETIRGLSNTLANHCPDVLIEINSNGNLNKVIELIPMQYDVYSIDEAIPQIKKPGWFFKRYRGSRNFLLTQRTGKALNDVLDKFRSL